MIAVLEAWRTPRKGQPVGLPDQSGEGLAIDGMCRISQGLYEVEEGGSAEQE